MKLHENLFELRRKAGLSQEELADRIGVSRQAVGKWENAAAVPELDKLIALSEVFGVGVGELLGLMYRYESLEGHHLPDGTGNRAGGSKVFLDYDLYN